MVGAKRSARQVVGTERDPLSPFIKIEMKSEMHPHTASFHLASIYYTGVNT